MSVKSCEKLDKSKVALTIEADAAAFEAAINKAYLQQRSKISVPGFRPGKAPRKMIESMYGAEVFYEEAVNILLPDAYEAAVKEQELNVVGYPEVELENCTKDGVVFKCTVAIYPEVKLGQYKGLEAPKAEVKVAAADVNARLKEMADRNSRLVSVEREIQKGDTADIDFEGFDNGVAFDGGKGENFDLEIGSGSFVPGFEDQLVGMKAGEEKDIDITFPENYTPELAGKPVVFHVKVNEVKHKEVPAIDDEFAKDVSEFDTLEELTEDLKKQAAQSKESQQALAARDALIDVLLDKVDIVLPESAVDHQVEHRVGEDAKPKAKKEAREAVEKEMRTELLSEALAKKFDVQVSQQELIDYAIQMSQNFGIDINQLFSSSQQMANVVADLGRSKALIEALKVVTVKDTNGADVDLSKFFGTDPATEEGAEIITEVADEQE